MNAKQLLAAAAILAASSVAFAHQDQGVSRDQVKAELADTLKNNRYDPISGQYVAIKAETKASGVSREQVKAELAAVQKTKAYDVIEGHYVLSPATAASTLSREQVKAELAAVQKTHAYDPVSGQYVAKRNS